MSDLEVKRTKVIFSLGGPGCPYIGNTPSASEILTYAMARGRKTLRDDEFEIDASLVFTGRIQKIRAGDVFTITLPLAIGVAGGYYDPTRLDILVEHEIKREQKAERRLGHTEDEKVHAHG